MALPAEIALQNTWQTYWRTFHDLNAVNVTEAFPYDNTTVPAIEQRKIRQVSLLQQLCELGISMQHGTRFACMHVYICSPVATGWPSPDLLGNTIIARQEVHEPRNVLVVSVPDHITFDACSIRPPPL